MDTNLRPLTHDEIYADAKKHKDNKGEPGLYVGFECLKDLYSHKKAGVTDWTGFPASGKSYLCLEVLFNLSERYGQRNGLYVPDVGSDKEVIAKLVKMYTGKDYTDRYQNQITDKELANAITWIMHHFVLFSKKDFKQGVTPIDFWELIATYKDGGGRLNNGFMDSWKNMKHLYSGRDDLYLDEILSIRNEIAESGNVHFHTIAHAVKTELNEQKGKRRIPNAWDIKGGGSWFANGKSIITVDYPDKSQTGCDVYISKVKPEDVGRIGEVVGSLRLDVKRGRYYETEHLDVLGLKYFAFDMQKRVSLVQSQEIQF